MNSGATTQRHVSRRFWNQQRNRDENSSDPAWAETRGNVRFTGKQMHLWDIRKPFQAACERAGIKDLRIHDLRHMATTILFLSGIPEAIIRKLTGHRSRELERYEHLLPALKNQTVDLIARELSTKSTPTATDNVDGLEPTEKLGGDDGARTRDLRRDRPAF